MSSPTRPTTCRSMVTRAVSGRSIIAPSPWLRAKWTRASTPLFLLGLVGTSPHSALMARSTSCACIGKDQRTSRRCGRSILRDKEPVHQQTIVIAIPTCLLRRRETRLTSEVAGYGDNAPADRPVRKKNHARVIWCGMRMAHQIATPERAEVLWLPRPAVFPA